MPTPFALRRTHQGLLVAALTFIAAVALPLGAQDRQLRWRALDVDARLDSAGQLHVRERQVMVFSGDWNGGERTFNVRLGQRLDVKRLARVDSATGSEVELREGDLSEVDQFGWGSGSTLRWRSRLPSDPPFSEKELTYVIDYTLGSILVPKDSVYLLNHDFAFPDRAGVIERYTLKLAIDPAWQAPADFTGSFASDTLYPGSGFVVTLPLRYTRAGVPAGVRLGAPREQRLGLIAALALGLALMAAVMLRREYALGRFASLTPAEQIDEAWLRANVFHILPEAVGAAWDNRTGAAEVTAVLARLVAEKKLASEVKTEKTWIFSRNVLHLRLLVDRKELRGHERELIDGLFMPGSNATDTDSVRKRYSSTGFDPASRIEAGVHRLIGDPKRADDDAPRPSRKVTLGLLAFALVLLVVGGISDPRGILVAVFGAGLSVVGWILSAPQAMAWRARTVSLAPHALRFLVPLGALATGLALLMLRDPLRLGVVTLAGLAVLVLAVGNSVFNAARSLQGAERVAMRKRLAAAREYFQRELKQREPRLRDEWFPWLIAFGLGSHLDHWFRAFGGPEATRLSRTSSSSFGGSSGSSSGSSWTGMGGGGGFAGGGSSGSWAAAAGLMASGVSKPRSSSSGGSSGGGSSSGGGGGGGW